MDNPTKPGMIGLSPNFETENASQTIYTEGQFVFSGLESYAFKAKGKDGSTSFGTGILITLSEDTFTVQYADSPRDWNETTFLLNQKTPGAQNLESFFVEQFSSCKDKRASVFGGIGTVDIRPGTEQYEWYSPQNAQFYMQWTMENLEILSPEPPKNCS